MLIETSAVTLVFDYLLFVLFFDFYLPVATVQVQFWENICTNERSIVSTMRGSI